MTDFEGALTAIQALGTGTELTRTIAGLEGALRGVARDEASLIASDAGIDEVSLSLGAGNTGRRHDLKTDRRVAEFKYIEWRGGAESIRQNSLLVDLFNLVIADTTNGACCTSSGGSCRCSS